MLKRTLSAMLASLALLGVTACGDGKPEWRDTTEGEIHRYTAWNGAGDTLHPLVVALTTNGNNWQPLRVIEGEMNDITDSTRLIIMFVVCNAGTPRSQCASADQPPATPAVYLEVVRFERSTTSNAFYSFEDYTFVATVADVRLACTVPRGVFTITPASVGQLHIVFETFVAAGVVTETDVIEIDFGLEPAGHPRYEDRTASGVIPWTCGPFSMQRVLEHLQN